MTKKAFKFRIFPNEEQKMLINKTIGCARFVFNQELADFKRQNEQYWFIIEEMVQNGQLPQNNWKSEFFNKVQAVNAVKKYKEHHAFLKEVDSIALQASVEDLADGYQRFYKKQNKQPNFKSKKNPKQSYTTKMVNNNIKIDGNKICLPKLGWIKFAKSREIEGVIKRVTVRKNPSGKYFVSILCDVEFFPYPTNDNAIGIDLGLKTFAVCSDGTTVKQDCLYLKIEKKLQKEKRKLSKRQKQALDKKIPMHEAKNYQKQRIKVAKMYEKIANKREDFLHKVSTDVIKNHDIICLEDLQVSKMLKNEDLSRKIGETAWRTFRTMIEYKAKWHNRTAVFVAKDYPSSQLCSCCGKRNRAVKDLGLRKWTCHCGVIHDRDLNAATNILQEGLRILADGTAVLA